MGTHACSLPLIWTVLQVKCKVFTCKKRKKVSDIKEINSMAVHERKTQQYDLRPARERLLLSVNQPKQQTVFKRDIGHREDKGKHTLKDIQKRFTVWIL